MRLLITAQAVDLDDPVLGFFHNWVKEFSDYFESVHVICLKEGRHNLPANVFIHSLGKRPLQGFPLDSKGNPWITRIKYIWRFYKYIWKLRKEHNAVFAHMNQEYVLMGGLLWRIMGKRVVLWRNHKMGSFLTIIAGGLSNTVCHTSPSAYVEQFKNAVKMPIGIDTEMFKPRGSAAPNSILFLGRLDAVKRPQTLLQALEILAKREVAFTADIVGDPTPGRESFANDLKERFSLVPNVTFKPAVRNDEAAAVYNAHSIYVNLTPSGSFDKTIGEAMASGCIAVVGNEAMRGVLPDEFLVDVNSAESVLEGIQSAMKMDAENRKKLTTKLRKHIVEQHSLPLLVDRLVGLYKPKV
ncbi:MAG: glycosyltransferase family 4 protein [bacterium]|nr:glycosyltransferase family 4 protein [bacterium]